MTIEIEFKGDLSLQHYIRAQLLHLTPARWVSGSVILILLALAGIYALIAPFDMEQVLPALLFFLIISASPHWFPYVQALQGQRILPSLRFIRGRAGGEGLTLMGAGSETVFRWSEYNRYRLSKKLLLLYLSSGGLQIYPQDLFLGDDSWRDFRGLVQQHIHSPN